MFKKVCTAVGSMVLLALATPAMAVDAPARIKSAGKFVVATQPNYAPIAYKNPETNKLMGFDVELAQAIAKVWGVDIEYQEIGFAQMLPSLITGRVDVAMAGMADLPARRETVDFVNYLITGPQFYTTPAGKAAGIHQPSDLCGKKVGASRSTNWPNQIVDWSKQHCEKLGKPAIQVVGTEGSVDARTQLKIGRLDAAVQGNETLPYFQKLEPNSYVLLGETFATTTVGIPVAKNDTATRDAIKAALEVLRTNGQYDALLAKYDLKQNSIAQFTINAGKAQ